MRWSYSTHKERKDGNKSLGRTRRRWKSSAKERTYRYRVWGYEVT